MFLQNLLENPERRKYFDFFSFRDSDFMLKSLKEPLPSSAGGCSSVALEEDPLHGAAWSDFALLIVKMTKIASLGILKLF